MSAKERALWEQAVRVLRQNSVTSNVSVQTPTRAEQVLAMACQRLAMRGVPQREGSQEEKKVS